MSGNTFGKIFKITTFGESHGTAMGCILDGCPPQIELTKEDIQNELDSKIQKALYSDSKQKLKDKL